MTTTLVLLAAVVIRILSNPLGNVFQKQLTMQGHHPLAVNFATYLLLSIICLIASFFIQWPSLSYSFWLYSVLGGIAGGVGNGFLVKALERGDLSVLGPINAYKSVIGVITGIFLLGELPNLWGLAGIGLIIYGSYYVLDTTEAKFSWALLRQKEIKYRILAMILTAIEAVFVKKVILASSTLISFFSWCWFGALFSFAFLFLSKINWDKSKQHLPFTHILRLFYLISCMGTMQLTTNYVFDHMPVGYALSLFQLSVLVSVILGYKVFQEKSIFKKLIGSIIMIAGSVLIILFKNR